RETLHQLRARLSDSRWPFFAWPPGQAGCADHRRGLLLALEAVTALGPAALDQFQYVDLDQMAAVVNMSKSSLEKRKRRKKKPLPDPDVPGGGGKKDWWLWSRIRPWLEAEFNKHFSETCPRRL